MAHVAHQLADPGSPSLGSGSQKEGVVQKGTWVGMLFVVLSPPPPHRGVLGAGGGVRREEGRGSQV